MKYNSSTHQQQPPPPSDSSQNNAVTLPLLGGEVGPSRVFDGRVFLSGKLPFLFPEWLVFCNGPPTTASVESDRNHMKDPRNFLC